MGWRTAVWVSWLGLGLNTAQLVGGVEWCRLIVMFPHTESSSLCTDTDMEESEACTQISHALNFPAVRRCARRKNTMYLYCEESWSMEAK